MQTQEYELKLRSRLNELTSRMRKVDQALDERPDPDPEERSVEREDDELLEQLGETAMTEVRKIEAAHERVSKGTFGTCVSCGERISDERLNLIPHAARCRDCI